MPHFSMLMQASTENAYVWFCILAVLCIVIFAAAFLLRKGSHQESDPSRLLRTDSRIAQIVLILSHMDPDTRNKSSRQTLRRFKYIVELKTRVAEHLPDASPEYIRNVCSGLLGAATKLRNTRKRTK